MEPPGVTVHYNPRLVIKTDSNGHNEVQYGGLTDKVTYPMAPYLTSKQCVLNESQIKELVDLIAQSKSVREQYMESQS